MRELPDRQFRNREAVELIGGGSELPDRQFRNEEALVVGTGNV